MLAAMGQRFDAMDRRFDKIEARLDAQDEAVDHAPRVHLDIETDDQEAERARLEGLGATTLERCDHGWIVMEAPTGHRFCLVASQTRGFAEGAVEW
jgi:hypothetical protein